MWLINGLNGVVRVLTRVFHRLRGVTTEVTAAFWTDDGREALWFRIRKRIYHSLFDPVGMATRTAAIFVPTAWIRIEGQERVHHRIGHRIAPHRFLEIICIL